MESTMKYINRIFRCGILYRNAALADKGLNGYQHLYIMKLCQNPGISQEELAKLVYINKSNVTRQLSLMEASGFVFRRTDENDRRSQQVFPTEKAYAIYPEVKKYVQLWNQILTEGLTEDESVFLVPVLKKMAQNAEKEIAKQ